MKKWIAGIIGIFLGMLISFSPGGTFIIFLAIASGLIINYISDKNERNFLLTIFFIGFGLRVFLSLLITSLAIFKGNLLDCTAHGCPYYITPYLIDDAGYYTLRAQITSMYWLGKPLTDNVIVDIVKHAYGFTGFVYLLSLYFTIFGYAPISSVFINCLLGSLNFIFVYFITKDIFREKSARISSILTAFFPSMFFWSTVNLKEPIFTLMILIMLLSVIRFVKTKKIYYIILASASLWLQSVIRAGYQEFFYLTITIILLYFFLLFVLDLIKRKKIFFIFSIFITLFFLSVIHRDKINFISQRLRARALIAYAGAIDTGGICYELLPREVLQKSSLTGSEFLQMLFNGWFHVILEPFPWNIKSKSLLLVFPQMLIWYFLVCFAIFGIGLSIRYKLKEALFLFIYLFSTISIFAVTGANIGTVFRLRDSVTPIFLIFASVGLVNVFNKLDLHIES